MTIYTDNAKVPLSGRIARVLCDMDRPDAITEGFDNFGAFLRFSVEAGDCCSEDVNREPPPKRSFLTIESMGNIPRYGKRLTQHFGLLVEPGPMIVKDAYSVICQWNQGPQNGNPWRSPSCEFGMVNVNKLNTENLMVKDSSGVPIREERLQLKVHALNADGKQIVSGSILSNEPLVRGKFIREIGIAFYDGRGGLGRAELWINGRQQGSTWTGKSGYEGYGSVYPAVGTYNHPGQSMPQAVRIYNYREAPLE